MRTTKLVTNSRAAARPYSNLAALIGAIGLVGVVTFILRTINLTSSFDIFIDEITYLKISQSIAGGLRVWLYNQPFFLHPPAYFFLEAGFLKIMPVQSDIIQQVYLVRYLNIIFASVTAALVFLIAFRAMGWAAGFLAAWLYAVNAFVIKVNSLNILETTAMAWVIAGYWVLISGMGEGWEPWPIKENLYQWILWLTGSHSGKLHSQSTPGSSPTERLSTWRFVLAGFLFGLGLLTKETTAFLSLLPLAVCFALNWSIPRRSAVLIGAITTLTYMIYPLIVFLNGDWSAFAQQKFRGVLRFIGILQITGFNRVNAPSLTGTLAQRFDQYGTTYLLLGLGVIATVILLSSRRGMMRLIGVWVACAYLMMTYLIFLGTLEEQFFFYLIVPCILACSIAAVVLFRASDWSRYGVTLFRSSGWYRKGQALVVPALLVVILLSSGWDARQWVKVHFTPNNGYERVMAFLRRDVPGGEKVAATSGVGQYILGGYLTGPYGLWHTVDDLKSYHPQFVLLTPQDFIFNYGSQGQEFLNWIQHNAIEIFAFQGQGNNQVLLYELLNTKGR